MPTKDDYTASIAYWEEKGSNYLELLNIYRCVWHLGSDADARMVCERYLDMYARRCRRAFFMVRLLRLAREKVNA